MRQYAGREIPDNVATRIETLERLIQKFAIEGLALLEEHAPIEFEPDEDKSLGKSWISVVSNKPKTIVHVWREGS